MLRRQWTKAIASGGGNCVQVRWTKATASLTNGTCVEVRIAPAQKDKQ